MKKKVDWIKFHKRFANGEQYLYITPWGEIETESKSYYWQERGVYNCIKPIIEKIITNNPSISEAQLYGKNGIVARLVPKQRTYNAIKNKKHEYMNMLSLGLMTVEEGTALLDALSKVEDRLLSKFNNIAQCYLLEEL